MKWISSFILFVLLAMIAEDAVSAHATSQSDSEKVISLLVNFQHDHSPLHGCDTGAHRDSSHFGHCSFLLVKPLRDPCLQVIFAAKSMWYFFSLKIGIPTSLLRPPIFLPLAY